jgi:hypothetical protein
MKFRKKKEVPVRYTGLFQALGIVKDNVNWRLVFKNSAGSGFFVIGSTGKTVFSSREEES